MDTRLKEHPVRTPGLQVSHFVPGSCRPIALSRRASGGMQKICHKRSYIPEIPTQTTIPGTGDLKALSDTNAAPAKFCKVGVSVPK